MLNLAVNLEVSTNDIVEAFMNDMTIDEMVDFVMDLVEKESDQDLTNGLYDALKAKHDEWLDEQDIDENEYRDEHSSYRYPDEMIEEGETVSGDEPDEDDEHWTTDPDEIDDELEEDVDVFTTEDDK